MYQFGGTAGSRECRGGHPVATKMALVAQREAIHTRYNCIGEQSWEAPIVKGSDRMVAVAKIAAAAVVDAGLGRYPNQLL